MSIEKIRQMRKERLTKVDPLKEKQEQIKDEPFITGTEYKDYTKRIKAEMKVNYLLSTRNDKPIAIGIVGI